MSFIHSFILPCYTLSSFSGRTALEFSTVESLLSRESVFIISAIAWALLPARIARYTFKLPCPYLNMSFPLPNHHHHLIPTRSRAKMTHSRWMNAKRDVTTLLNSPLKLVGSTTTFHPLHTSPCFLLSHTLSLGFFGTG